MSNLLIVAALKDEIRDVKAQMVVDCTIHYKPAVYCRGPIKDKSFGLLVTGLGPEKMRKGLEEVLSQDQPTSVVYVGYAGGASPVVGLGSLVLADKVVKQKSGERFFADKSLLCQAQKICQENRWSFHTGGMVTVDRIIASPHEKADLGAVHTALALDMEAAVLAEVAGEYHVPWLVAKTILDPVEMRLPDLQDCVEETGEANPLLMMEHLCKNPKDLMKLPKLQYCATEARRSLTQFVEAWVRYSSPGKISY